MGRRSAVQLLVLLALAVVACASSPPVQLAVRWQPCTLRTNAGEPAECATVEVPARWEAADGAKLSLAVRRFHPPGVATRGQLWLLQGGPGAASPSFDGAGPYFAKLGLDLDIYLVDQRGTGGSSRLGCPDQEAPTSPGGTAILDAEWPACLDALARQPVPLAAFAVTQTARDLGELIAATRGPQDRVFVYGVSYATYLVNRYLQLYPDQATGVILDSVCGADVCRSSQADARFDAAARLYFEACGANTTCAARLGPDPWATLGHVLDGLDRGDCPAATSAGLDRTAVSRMLAQLLYDWDRRVLALATVYRIARCGSQDVPVIARLGAAFHAPSQSAGEFSTVLATHVALSELWDEPPPTRDQVAAIDASLSISNGLAIKLASLFDRWPRVPHDAYWNRWATTSIPILMMNGSLDPATPLAMQTSARAAFAGPQQTFVTVPNAPHGVLLTSPVSVLGEPACGTQLALSFLRADGATVDTSCTMRMRSLDFDASPQTTGFFGTADLWGD